MNAFFNLLILSGLFLLVFAIGEIAYRIYKVPAEYTRKWSHIASGALSLLFPVFFDNIRMVGLICALFILVLNFSKPLGLLPSINNVDRRTYGSILFPVAVFIAYAAYETQGKDLLFFYLPVLTLAISDLCAAMVGKRYPLRKLGFAGEPKSLGGFLAFFCSAALLYVVFIYLGYHISIPGLVIIALLGAITELLSPRGFDNISIPLIVILGLMLVN